MAHDMTSIEFLTTDPTLYPAQASESCKSERPSLAVQVLIAVALITGYL